MTTYLAGERAPQYRGYWQFNEAVLRNSHPGMQLHSETWIHAHTECARTARIVRT